MIKRTIKQLLPAKKELVSYSHPIEFREIHFFHNVYFKNALTTYKTEKKINKQGLFRFGTDKTKVLKTYGKPVAKNCLKESTAIKMYYFKQKISGIKTTCEFSFHKDKLFHFSYSFKYLNINEKEELISLLLKKYLDKNNFSSDCKIIDPIGNILTIEDSIYLTVSYFSNDQKIIEELKPTYENSMIEGKVSDSPEIQKLYKIL